MTDLFRSVRSSLTRIGRTPTASLLVLACLGLGIGITTAVVGTLYAVVLAPLPYAHPHELVRISEVRLDTGWDDLPTSHSNFEDWRQARSLAATAAFQPRSFTVAAPVGSAEPPDRRSGAEISPGLLDLLGTPVAHGRRPSAEASEVVVSHSYWHDSLGGRVEALGRRLELDGEPHTVVGVLPEGFRFPLGIEADLLTTLPSDGARAEKSLVVVGRLAPGVGLEQAGRELELLGEALREAHPVANEGIGIGVESLRADLVTFVEKPLWLLLAAALLVLAIAAVDVASLVLVQGLARRGELAMRAALGAPRRALVAQVLLDALVLAVGGSLLGLAFAWAALELVSATAPAGIPRLAEARPHPLAFALGVGSGLAVTTLAALRPALVSSRVDLQRLGRPSESGRVGGHARRALIVAQLALATVLLAASGLVVWGFTVARAASPGFEPARLATLQLSLPREAYPDPPARSAFYQGLLADLQTLPGIEGAAVTSVFPASTQGYGEEVVFGGESSGPPRGARSSVEVRSVSAGYHDVLGIARHTGRLFGPDDVGAAVALVDEPLARRHFGDSSPVGETLTVAPGTEDERSYRIVGVVAGVRHWGLDAPAPPTLYLPFDAAPWRTVRLVLRTRGEPAAVLEPVRRAVAETDPRVPVYSYSTAEELLGNLLAARRLEVLLLAIFAGTALVLAVAGIYGLVSYGLQLRRTEMGVRTALGATRSDLRRLVFVEVLVDCGWGLALGGLGAAAIAGVVVGLLPETVELPAAAWLAGPVLLLLGSVAAAVPSALRAARPDLGRVLRGA